MKASTALISRRRAVQLAAATLLPSRALTAMAQADFPSRAVRIVVPFPAGGNSDVIARTIAQRLTQAWNQPVVVDNKPGADTVIATSDVARAAPDGHTLLMNISLIVQNTVTKERLPFDTFKELRPLIAATETPMYFVAGQAGSERPTSLDEFLKISKARPGLLTFGSFGMGSTGHLLLLALQRAATVDITHVPFKGNSDVIIQLLNGQIASSFLPYSAIAPHLAGGKIRILAATGETRPMIAPGVPTFEELGIKGFTASQWNGFFVSTRTPKTAMDRLTRDFDTAIKSAEVSTRLNALGLTPVGGTPEQFQKMIDRDFELIRTAIRSGQYKPE